jgi:two-component system, NarL family, response regulator LiaR
MSNQERIRVAIVDDNEMLRSGLSMFLRAFEDLELVGTASEGSEVLQMCRETHPDVVLMDLVMPGMDGVCATRAIKQAFPDIQVITLTSFDDQHLVGESLAAGAVMSLLKNVLIDELANAIRSANAMTNVDAH